MQLKALGRDDFVRILTMPDFSLVKQTTALLATEGVTVEFTDDAVEKLAEVAGVCACVHRGRGHSHHRASVCTIRVPIIVVTLCVQCACGSGDEFYGGRYRRSQAAHGGGESR